MGRYIVYIDEAGDDGFSMLGKEGPTGQSQCLVLGAIIVNTDHDRKVTAWRDDILAQFPYRQTRNLHFRELKHEQKVVACQKVAALPIGACVVMSNKTTIPGSSYEKTFSAKGYLYNYLIRWLLERVTEACHRASTPPCSVKVVFSRRKGMNYDAMRDYMRLMRDGREMMQARRSIDWSVLKIDEIEVEDHSNRAGLQLADCVTSAFFSGLEPNRYGNNEPRYGLLLKDILVSGRNGSIENCGFTPVPSTGGFRPSPDQRQFMLDCIWKAKK